MSNNKIVLSTVSAQKKRHQDILHDKQIKKFSIYGFLKDLKFFEPYLLIFLMGNDISLLQIGLLFSIREIIINVFEVPSGLIADYFGRKKELCACFVFYIVSFILFFFSKNFFIAAIAMAFFGMGEALRSGTHKAMIFTYLEKMNWQSEKSFVYGKTRSSSLTGSALSSLIGILIILNIPSSSYIFLASTIPYILDFILILSYPSYLDVKMAQENVPITQMFVVLGRSLKRNKDLRHILANEGLFEGIISTIKDLIQPILQGLILGSGFFLVANLTSEDNLNVILGLVYCAINILCATASRRSYRLKKWNTGVFWINLFTILLAVLLALFGLPIKSVILTIVVFLIIQIVQNYRKPIYIDQLDEYMEKSERATMLSIASQLKSIVVIILAPIVGYVAGILGLQMTIFFLAILVFVLLPFTRLSEKKA
jgi:MFS family permease